MGGLGVGGGSGFLVSCDDEAVLGAVDDEAAGIVSPHQRNWGWLGGGYVPACAPGGWWLRVALPLLSFSLKLPSLKALYHFFMMK